MVDFSKLSSMTMDEVKAPPALPAGDANGVITAYKLGESRFTNEDTGDKDGVLTLTLRGNGYADGTELPHGATFKGKSFFVEYSLIDSHGNALAGLYHAMRLLQGLGIPTEGRSPDQCWPDLINQQVVFEITQREYPKGSGEFINNARKIRAIS